MKLIRNSLFFICFLYTIVSCSRFSSVSAGNAFIKSKIDTVTIYDESRIDSLSKIIKHQADSIRLLQDSVNFYKDTLQWENYANYINARRIEKVKYYITICEKRPANKKYFFGWIRRAVSE